MEQIEYEVFDPPQDEYYEQACKSAYAIMFSEIPLSKQKEGDSSV